MLRLTFGMGGATAHDDLNDLQLSGRASYFSVDLGGSVAPNLALHGRLSVHSMFEPELSGGAEPSGELEDTTLFVSLLGAGLTYYLPANIYWTSVLGASRASFQRGGDEYAVLYGGGLITDLGYEWRMTEDWGMGLAGHLELHALQGNDDQLSTLALGVLVSMTYF